jgi:hypothetical protein
MKRYQEIVRMCVEYTWLVIACVSLVFAIYSCVKYGVWNKDTVTFFIITPISFFMYFVRRKTRLTKSVK